MTIPTGKMISILTLVSFLFALPALADQNHRHKKQHNKIHSQSKHQKNHQNTGIHHHRKHHDKRHDNYYGYATVIQSKPLYRKVNRPQQYCWEERVRVPSRHQSLSGTIAGGLIGGVVGHQFGGGHGKDALTVAGAAIGASIGHESDKKRDYYSSVVQTRRHCEMQNNYVSELEGYKVKYRYKGGIYSTVLDYDPGTHINIRMDLASYTHHY